MAPAGTGGTVECGVQVVEEFVDEEGQQIDAAADSSAAAVFGAGEH